jgi:hypothetical protein
MHPGQQTRLHAFEMVRRDVAFVREFFRALDPATRARTGLTEEALERALRHRLHNAFFQQGRRLLLAGQRAEARSQFVSALRLGSPYTKAKALAGLACTVLGRDLEELARLTRRPRLR